jgi:hypothetical protein
MRTSVRGERRSNCFFHSPMTLGRLSLIAIALWISLSTGVFAAQAATRVAPIRLVTQINGEMVG